MDKTSNKLIYYLLNFIGVSLLIVGGTAACVAPAESYCYYLFSEGGRFHYEGFGFGSFMFANITMQIWAYYIISLVCIPLGIGHLKKQVWIQNISLAFLWVWFIVGIPILTIILSIFITNKEPSFFLVAISGLIALLSYTLIPTLLIKFYNSKQVEIALLNMNGKRNNFIKNYPVLLIMMIILYVFYIFAFHCFLLLRGIFPFGWQFVVDFKGIVLNSISILILVLIIIGTLKKKLWSWWTSFIYFTVVTASSLITLLLSDFSELVTLLKLPPTETNALINIPLKGFHLTGIFGIPIIITLGVIIFSRKHFIVLKNRITNKST